MPCRTFASPAHVSTPQWLAIPALAALLVLGTHVSALAGPPTDAVKGTSEKVVRLLNDEALKLPERANERRQRLVEIVAERFNYEEMCRRSLGEQWLKLKEAEKQEFIALFQMLLAKSYATKVEGYAGEKVQYLGERLANGYAEVRARISSAKQELLVDFRLVDRAGDWLVYDIVVDGISLVSSYRGQFARMLRLWSYGDLVERMRQTADLPLQARAQ
ncbi:MlaC/ttg2D family ABC transporter substrate-binding protein [Candidatus Nitrospira bockiana]